MTGHAGREFRWGVRNPNEYELTCQVCGEPFLSVQPTAKRCPEHRLRTQPAGVRELECPRCHKNFTMKSGSGSGKGSGTRKYCSTCLPIVHSEAAERQRLHRLHKSGLIGQSPARGPFEFLPYEDIGSEDDPYERIQDDFIKDTRAVVEQLARDEIVWAKHAELAMPVHPLDFFVLPIDAAIENYRAMHPDKVESMAYSMRLQENVARQRELDPRSDEEIKREIKLLQKRLYYRRKVAKLRKGT